MAKIYESPDKGKTIYERKFGEDDRKQIKPDEEKTKRIWNFMVAVSERQLKQQIEEFEKREKISHADMHAASK